MTAAQNGLRVLRTSRSAVLHYVWTVMLG